MSKNNTHNKKGVTRSNRDYKVIQSSIIKSEFKTFGSPSQNDLNASSSKYEEINDYSFLNTLTEEIVKLTDIDDLKNILNCKEYIDTNSILVSKEEYDIIKGLDNLEYKAVLHNVNSISYLEILNSNNDANYTLRLCGNKFCKVEKSLLDNDLVGSIKDGGFKIE